LAYFIRLLRLRKAEVVGSSPIISTKHFNKLGGHLMTVPPWLGHQ